jgi:hypothetical protein
MGSVAGGLRRAAERLCGVGLGGAPVKRREFSRFWAGVVAAGAGGRVAEERCGR